MPVIYPIFFSLFLSCCLECRWCLQEHDVHILRDLRAVSGGWTETSIIRDSQRRRAPLLQLCVMITDSSFYLVTIRW